MISRREVGALLVVLATAAAPSPAGAAATLTATPSIETAEGATRLVVTLASKRRFTARTRPRRVAVVAGENRIVLARRKLTARRAIFRSTRRTGAGATALRALAGTRIAVEVRTRAGTRTLRRSLPEADPGSSPGNPAPGPGTGTPPPATGDPGAGTPRPGDTGEPPPPGDSETPPRGEAALAAANQQIGRPYQQGGADPSTGFDAPGLTQYVYRQAGAELPRAAEEQARAGVAADLGALGLGDLVFFRDDSGAIAHVGVYAGDGEFIHAPGAGDVVKTSRLSDPYYHDRLRTARHIP